MPHGPAVCVGCFRQEQQRWWQHQSPGGDKAPWREHELAGGGGDKVVPGFPVIDPRKLHSLQTGGQLDSSREEVSCARVTKWPTRPTNMVEITHGKVWENT